MELAMGKKDYFCIGNLEPCRNTIDIMMTVAYADGAEETFIGADMNGAQKKAENALLDGNDELWIKTNLRDKSIAKVMLSLNNPNGELEQYCLKWGIASFDDSICLYSVNWRDTLLTSDEIELTVQGETVSVSMRTKKGSSSDPIVAKGDSLQKTAEDIKLCVSADRKILEYYTGDARADAEALLNKAAESAESGNVQEAESCIREAEEKIAGCVSVAMSAVKMYTLASNKKISEEKPNGNYQSA